MRKIRALQLRTYILTVFTILLMTMPVKASSSARRVGTFIQPDRKISTELYEINKENGILAQVITDNENSAAWITWFAKPVISDHSHQGFGLMYNVSLGEHAYIKDAAGTIHSYKAIDTFYGYNEGSYLADAGKADVMARAATFDFITYTCSPSSSYVIHVILWKGEGVVPSVPGQNSAQNKAPASGKKTDTIDIKDTVISYNKDQVYKGKPLKPRITVTYNGKAVSKEYYSVQYKDNGKPGYGKIILKGKGKYCGTETVIFKIRPQKPRITSIKSKNRKLYIKWKKIKKVDGYEIQYTTDKRFTGYSKKETKKSSFKINGLKKGKTYYVRVSAFKIVNGEKIYSDVSKVKKVKVR